MIVDNSIKLRKLRDNNLDYKKLEKWYQQKEIYSQFEQRKLNIDEIVNKYYPRTLNDSSVPVYMIEYNNNPIGIIQYKLIDDDNKKLYKLSQDKCCYELDIFIGELEYHGKKIGQKSIELLSNYIFNNMGADLLVMCPLKDNIKAIKCYEKCGYKIIDEFITEDTIGTLQKYVLMIKEK